MILPRRFRAALLACLAGASVALAANAKRSAPTRPDDGIPDATAFKGAIVAERERFVRAFTAHLLRFALGRELAAQHRSLQAFQDLQERWVEEVKADPAIGGTKLNGALARSLSLPCDVDESRSSAKYEDGVLTLTLPKAKAERGARLQVQ